MTPIGESRSALRRLMGRSGSGRRVLITAVIVCAGAVLLGSASPALHEFAMSTLINVVIVVGLFTFVGNSGVVSFGHISFMALGAYITGLLTTPPGQKQFLLPDLPHWIATMHLSALPAAVVAVVVVALIAAVIGIPLMRLSGIAATIATLSLILVVNVVIVQTTTWTAGNQAFIGVPLIGSTWFAAAAAAVAIAASFLFSRSSLGLRLRASREDEPAARATGIRVVRERTVAWAVSAGIVALAGVVYAHFLGSFDPSTFYLELSFITLAMLVVGGIYSLMGAIVGTLVISTVEEILGRLENGEGVGPIHLTLHDGTTDIVLAVIVIAVMVLRPGGIMGGGRPGRRRPKRTAVSAADDVRPDGPASR